MLKTTIDLSDLVGLHFIMTQIAGKGQLKFMVAGLGWATAELIMTRSVIGLITNQFIPINPSNTYHLVTGDTLT